MDSLLALTTSLPPTGLLRYPWGTPGELGILPHFHGEPGEPISKGNLRGKVSPSFTTSRTNEGKRGETGGNGGGHGGK